MKRFLCLLSLISFNASADIILDSDEIILPAREVTLVRTKDTPARVTLKITLEEFETKCVEKAIKTVDGPHPTCGQYTTEERYCGNFSMSGFECSNPSPFDRWETVIHNRSCVHDEIYCKTYERIVHGQKEHEYEIFFKKVFVLKEGQQDTFKFQIHTNEKMGWYIPDLSLLKSSKKYSITKEGNEFTIRRKLFQ